MEIRSYYGYDADLVSLQTGLECKDASLTIQSQKDEADINVIFRRFGLGVLPVQNVRTPMYGDFTGITSYRDALEAVALAEDSFMALPADFRAKLENDPQKFLEFCADEKNRPEMEKLGMVVPKVVDKPAVPA